MGLDFDVIGHENAGLNVVACMRKPWKDGKGRRFANMMLGRLISGW
jgi:hypothetical protein